MVVKESTGSVARQSLGSNPSSTTTCCWSWANDLTSQTSVLICKVSYSTYSPITKGCWED